MKKKNLFQRIFGSAIVRGALKTVPVGNWIYELVENIQFSKDPANHGVKPPHSYVSLLTQGVGLAFILYAFATHRITVDEVLRLLNVQGLDAASVISSGVDSVSAK